MFDLFLLETPRYIWKPTSLFGHIVKHGVEWSGLELICKTWTEFVKHGFAKGGLIKGGFVIGGFVKHGFVKHGFVKCGFVKHDNLELKRATRKVQIFFSRRSNRKPCRGQ